MEKLLKQNLKKGLLKASRFQKKLTQKLKDKSGLSQMMEVLILILVVVVLGALVLGIFKVNVPQLIGTLFEKIMALFN